MVELLTFVNIAYTNKQKHEIMKSDNQITSELLERNNLSEIKKELTFVFFKDSRGLIDYNNIGHTLIELVKENSKNSTNSIAREAMDKEIDLSDENIILISKEISEKIELYKEYMKIYDEKCQQELMALLGDF